MIKISVRVSLVILVLLSLCALAAEPERPFGVVDDLAWEPSADLNAVIDKIAAARVQIVRMDFRWYMIEPANDQWVFTVHDPIVSALKARGIEVLGILDDVPPWANGQSGDWSGTYPPLADADWSDYIHHVAAHYKGQVVAWEVWNEENIAQYFRPGPDPARYVQLLQSGHQAIKSEDPGAVVLLGGLAGNGVDMGWEPLESKNFLQKVYDNGGGAYFDAVAIHPYVHPVNVGFSGLQQFVQATLAVMSNNGQPNKPLWITEIGWSTAPNTFSQPTITEADAAAWVDSVYGGLASLGAARVFWYNFRDSGPDPLNVEHNFGLVRRNLAAKPSFDRYLAKAEAAWKRRRGQTISN